MSFQWNRNSRKHGACCSGVLDKLSELVTKWTRVSTGFGNMYLDFLWLCDCLTYCLGAQVCLRYESVQWSKFKVFLHRHHAHWAFTTLCHLSCPSDPFSTHTHIVLILYMCACVRHAFGVAVFLFVLDTNIFFRHQIAVIKFPVHQVSDACWSSTRHNKQR